MIELLKGSFLCAYWASFRLAISAALGVLTMKGKASLLLSVFFSVFLMEIVMPCIKAHVFVYPTRIGHIVQFISSSGGVCDSVTITTTSVDALVVEQLSQKPRETSTN
jgi:hypothetical protein